MSNSSEPDEYVKQLQNTWDPRNFPGPWTYSRPVDPENTQSRIDEQARAASIIRETFQSEIGRVLFRSLQEAFTESPPMYEQLRTHPVLRKAWDNLCMALKDGDFEQIQAAAERYLAARRLSIGDNE